MYWFFHTFFYNPIYNALVFIVSTIPGGDVGLSIILLTVLVKLILFPLSLKAARTQLLMREIDPLLREIKEKYKENKEEQALKTLALYREKNVNPFAVILLTFIQIPIILGLYFVFFNEKLPIINTDILYSFIHAPEQVNLILFGIFDVSKTSVILGVLAGVTQFLQVRLSMPKPAPLKEGVTPSFSDDFARSMQMQMQYVLPVIITGVALSVAAAISLYFVVSNLFAIGQELYIKREREAKGEATPTTA
ncbi:MAG: YidC/Oxa1 family membrane protein insertase [Nitrospira sp.]